MNSTAKFRKSAELKGKSKLKSNLGSIERYPPMQMNYKIIQRTWSHNRKASDLDLEEHGKQMMINKSKNPLRVAIKIERNVTGMNLDGIYYLKQKENERLWLVDVN